MLQDSISLKKNFFVLIYNVIILHGKNLDFSKKKIDKKKKYVKLAIIVNIL